jgi:curved DNA-binding protein
MDYKDYYQILGVAKNADSQAIKKAYRNLARQYHPDTNPENAQAEEKLKGINEAYEVLGKPENRVKYDQLGQNYHRFQQMGGNPGDFDYSQFFNGGGRRQQGGVNLNDIFGSSGGNAAFSDFFSQIFGGGAAGFAQQTAGRTAVQANIEQPVSITLEEAYHGTTRTFGQNGAQFTAKIPAGAKKGTRIRLRGKGNVTRNGRGDLFLRISIQPHKTFDLDGHNLRVTVPVDVTTAVLGGKVTIPTLTGSVQLTIPAGTQGGQTFRLAGKGMLKQGNQSHGDLLARITLSIPSQLTDAQKELYEQLANLNS